MARANGERWGYNSGGSHVLAGIVKQASSASPYDFARQHLFDPLGIGEVIWPVDPEGINLGGWGLQMTARDLARFGQLYLDQGRWQGRQIISPGWVATSTARHSAGSMNSSYGYQWWLPIYGGSMANGYGGQFILVHPERQASLPSLARQISDKVYALEQNALRLEAFGFTFEVNQAIAHFIAHGREQQAAVGVDGLYRLTQVLRPATSQPSAGEDAEGFVALRGRWSDEQTFELDYLRESDELQRMRFKFTGADVTLEQRGVAGERQRVQGRQV